MEHQEICPEASWEHQELYTEPPIQGIFPIKAPPPRQETTRNPQTKHDHGIFLSICLSKSTNNVSHRHGQQNLSKQGKVKGAIHLLSATEAKESLFRLG